MYSDYQSCRGCLYAILLLQCIGTITGDFNVTIKEALPGFKGGPAYNIMLQISLSLAEGSELYNESLDDCLVPVNGSEFRVRTVVISETIGGTLYWYEVDYYNNMSCTNGSLEGVVRSNDKITLIKLNVAITPITLDVTCSGQDVVYLSDESLSQKQIQFIWSGSISDQVASYTFQYLLNGVTVENPWDLETTWKFISCGPPPTAATTTLAATTSTSTSVVSASTSTSTPVVAASTSISTSAVSTSTAGSNLSTSLGIGANGSTRKPSVSYSIGSIAAFIWWSMYLPSNQRSN